MTRQASSRSDQTPLPDENDEASESPREIDVVLLLGIHNFETEWRAVGNDDGQATHREPFQRVRMDRATAACACVVTAC